MKVILFDIDGTLLLTGASGLQAIEITLKELFGIDKPSEVEVHGQTDRGIAGKLFKAHGVEDSDENFQAFCQCYLGHLEATLPLRTGQLMPNVSNLLDQLHQLENVHVGLLTGNMRKGAELKLKHFAIDHYFQFGGYGDLHPERNDVALFAKQDAERHLGHELDPDTIWVIGDTPNDIRCAKSIGAKVMAVATGKNSVDELREHQPDVVLEDLTTAEEWLCG